MHNWTCPDTRFRAWAWIDGLIVVRGKILQAPSLSNGKCVPFLKIIHEGTSVRALVSSLIHDGPPLKKSYQETQVQNK
jgi:hypothetical protein